VLVKVMPLPPQKEMVPVWSLVRKSSRKKTFLLKRLERNQRKKQPFRTKNIKA